MIVVPPDVTQIKPLIFSRIAPSHVVLSKWALLLSDYIHQYLKKGFTIESFTIEDVSPDVHYISNDPLAPKENTVEKSLNA